MPNKEIDTFLRRRDVISFLDQYEKNWPHYEQAASTTTQWLESILRTNKIKGVVSSRIKCQNSLKDKLLNRFKNAAEPLTIDGILQEIDDIAGTRVAVYFPIDSLALEPFIYEQYDHVTYRAVTEPFRGSPKRFGYSAEHYYVHHKSWPRIIRVEIQVASLLMHAWSEIAHDLEYKSKLEKPLDFDEEAILDAASGSVRQCEILLNTVKQSLLLKNETVFYRPPEHKSGGELLERTMTLLRIIGQNLHGLLTDDEFVKTLIKVLRERPLQVELVIGDADPTTLYARNLSYGGPKFFEHHNESVEIMRALKRMNLDNLRCYTSAKVERESVFFSDPDDHQRGTLHLKRVPPGSRPEDRVKVIIHRQQHPERFKELWDDKYKSMLQDKRKTREIVG